MMIHKPEYLDAEVEWRFPCPGTECFPWNYWRKEECS